MKQKEGGVTSLATSVSPIDGGAPPAAPPSSPPTWSQGVGGGGGGVGGEVGRFMKFIRYI